uniref:Uncharacterized protein n=1 Tax=Arundo donax TaxID=35708 RepID=A0A0A9AFV7_ARUDO
MKCLSNTSHCIQSLMIPPNK